MKLSRASRAARFILVLTALILPSLSLLPLGGLYLWEKGYLLWWALASAAVVSVVFAAQRWLLKQPEIEHPAASATVDKSSRVNQAWSPVEQRAWDDVKLLAAKVDVDKLVDPQALFDLGHTTVNEVARRLHPEKDDALWQFTMPEALAITERVSQRLGRFIENNIPFGDRLTVSQVMTVYSWRSLADVAERAYDIWRIVRLANPATAITHEARERLSRAMLTWGKEHVTRRLAETFVLEVGRAAIDLYGGRLRITPDDVLSNKFDTSSVADVGAGSSAPFKVLIAGIERARFSDLTAVFNSIQQTRAELVAAFVRGETSSAEFTRLSATEVRATRATGDAAGDLKILGKESAQVDIIAWVRSATSPMTDIERGWLRAAGAAHPLPPVLLPIFYTAADVSAPDLEAWSNAARAIYGGVVGQPVTLVAGTADQVATATALWAGLARVAADARRVQLARGLDALKNHRDWSGTARRTATAVGSLAKAILPDRLRRLK